MAEASVSCFVADEENQRRSFPLRRQRRPQSSIAELHGRASHLLSRPRSKCVEAPSFVDFCHSHESKLLLARPREDLVAKEKVRNAIFERAYPVVGASGNDGRQ